MIQQIELQKSSSKLEILESSSVIKPEKFYPAEILSNAAFQELLSQRQNLNQTLRNIFSKIKDPLTEISDALNAKDISEAELCVVYSELTKFLNADENNRRILLYLPFKILLNPPDIIDENLKTTYQSFLKKYVDCWYLLLSERDTRASFIDGDVFEEGMQQPERVRKAAHLIPELIKRSVISADEVITLIDEAEDYELSASLIEGFISAYYQGFLKEAELKRFIGLTQYNQMLREAFRSVKLRIFKSRKSERSFSNFDELISELENEIREAKINPDEFPYSQGRRIWLESTAEERIVETYSKLVAKNFYNEIFASPEVLKPELFLKSIFEYTHSRQKITSAELQIINMYWLQNDLKVRDVIVTGMSRLARLGVVNENVLRRYGITLQDLSIGSVESKFLKDEISEFTHSFELIAEHPILSKYIYPTVILFGSKVKGYASTNSDVDAAIFFKLEAEFADRDLLIQLLRQIPAFTNIDKILEFWLAQNDDGYSFKTPEGKIPTVMSAAEIHILFNGIWIGGGSQILREFILQKYFNLERFGSNKEHIRYHLLRQLELDALQFRIMHKGYRKSYPLLKEIAPNHGELIDWDSDFWDEGYRRTATLLFLNKIFLPNLLMEQ